MKDSVLYIYIYNESGIQFAHLDVICMAFEDMRNVAQDSSPVLLFA